METPDNIGPAGGDASSGNGGSQNQLNLIELYKMGIRAITDDIRQQLRALPLRRLQKFSRSANLAGCAKSAA